MTRDSYLSLFALIVILSWWPIIILFYYHYVLHYYLFIAWRPIMHATIYLFQILSSVSTFFP